MCSLIKSRYIELFALILLLIIVGINMVSHVQHDYSMTNLHLIQAHFLSKGHLDIPFRTSDIAIYNNHYYNVFPPFPAFLLVPLVIVLGAESIKVTLVSILLTLLNVIVFYRILTHLDIEKSTIPWLLTAFFFGTAYWYCLTMSMWIWYYSQIVGTTLMLLALHEALVRNRLLTAGLCLGFAFLSRQMSIYSVIFFFVLIWEQTKDFTNREKIMRLLVFSSTIGLCIGFYLLLNWLRFDDIFETGYKFIQYNGTQKARLEQYGLFHPIYIPFNFAYMFLQGFHIQFAPPTYVKIESMDLFGTSLISASPFFLFALCAKWTKPLIWAAWISISISIIHLLFYFINGHIQLNAQRYPLDFIPLLMLLVAKGLDGNKPVLWKSTIIYAVILNCIAIVLIGL